jgi:UDPglucose--hexose-1-phosphate uridylyltransferase
MSSEIRRNPITKGHVVIAERRAGRPVDFKKEGPSASNDLPEECPFCLGHESETPPSILEHRSASTWHQRVFFNKFRAFDIEGGLEKRRDGLFWAMHARGAHEVIVTTPRHENLYGMTDEEAFSTLLACKERIIDLKKAREREGEGEGGRKDPKLAYIIVFGNEGKAAGASRKHAHLQLIGLPIIPVILREEFRRAEEYWEDQNTCIFCDLVKQERNEKERLVTENDTFLSVCSYAAKFPFETWILSKSHLPIFEDGTEKTLRALAEVLMGTLRRMRKALEEPAFNLYLHNSPLFDRNHDRYFDFHLEIEPRLTQLAGFELGTGFYINPMPPEKAAQMLRDASN